MVGELGIRFFFIIGIAIEFVECNFKPPSPRCKSYLRTVYGIRLIKLHITFAPPGVRYINSWKFALVVIALHIKSI